MKITKPKQYRLKATTTFYFQCYSVVNFEHINPDLYWYKREYDHNNNQIYYENSDGFWIKWEYDIFGNEIYKENYNGVM